MIEVKAGNTCHRRTIAKFSKATAPVCAPCLRPAGKANIDYVGFEQVVHVLIRGSLRLHRLQIKYAAVLGALSRLN